jgi:acetyl-CoA C-acetyltransferase
MRPTTTMQSLAQLAPSFVQMGEMYGFDAVAMQAHPDVESVTHVHHAGKSSGIVDGAAAVLIGNKERRQDRQEAARAHPRVRQYRLRARHHAHRPDRRTRKVLAKAGMTIEDIDLFELNEAFASVVLRYMQALNIPHDKINVAAARLRWAIRSARTGAMIFGTVLDELERRDLTPRWCTLCIGAGMGTATIIERV